MDFCASKGWGVADLSNLKSPRVFFVCLFVCFIEFSEPPQMWTCDFLWSCMLLGEPVWVSNSQGYWVFEVSTVSMNLLLWISIFITISSKLFLDKGNFTNDCYVNTRFFFLKNDYWVSNGYSNDVLIYQAEKQKEIHDHILLFYFNC